MSLSHRIAASLLAAAFALLLQGASVPEPVRAPLQTFRDCSDCPELVLIPRGEFQMGSPAGGPKRPVDETPQHHVTIAKAFAIGKFKVTRGQYARFVSETHYDATKGGCAGLLPGKDYTDDPKQNWQNPGWRQTDQHPVICMGWQDAVAYLDWLSKKTGQHYRLPSEAEWEYAARAGTRSEYWFGDDVNAGCIFQNASDLDAKSIYPSWEAAQCHDGFAQSAPVGHYKPNAFGLYDMAGNAWELLADCFHQTYDGAPIDGSAWVAELNPGDCHNHMRRGGSWDHFTWITRSATRLSDEVDVHFRKANTGFRVARDL